MSDARIERIENIECETDKLRETVYGNGRPGLVTRMSNVETKMNDFDDIKKRLARIEKALYAACGAVALAKFLFH